VLRWVSGGITIEIGARKRRALRVRRREGEAEGHPTGGEEEEEAPAAPRPKRKAEALPESWPPFVTRGWLWKKGHVRTNWKRRYFLLAEDWSRLSYYERIRDDRPVGDALGKLDLAGAVATLGLDYVPKRAHVFSFTVRTKDEVYYFEAASEEERQRWIRTLNTAGKARCLPPFLTLRDDDNEGEDDDDAEGEDSEEEEEEEEESSSMGGPPLPLGRRRPRRRRRVGFSSSSSLSSLSHSQRSQRGLVTAFDRSCVDAVIDDIVEYHKERAVMRANRILNAEKTLAQINGALRGAYVVEAVELRLLDPVAGVRVSSAALAKTPRAVAERLERRFATGAAAAAKKSKGANVNVHRLLVDFEWPQRLELRVRGLRPKGGGLPAVLRAVVPRNLLFKSHAISFSLASRLDGSAALAFDLVSSRHAPWPKLRRVAIDKLPRAGLDNDALDVDDDRGLLGVLFSIVPREVIVGLLENAINDAVHRPGRPQLAWDVLGQADLASSKQAPPQAPAAFLGGEKKKEQHPPKKKSTATNKADNDDDDDDDTGLTDKWLHARPVSTSTVDALKSLAAIAAQAARAAARDSAFAASRVSAAAEGLRAAVSGYSDDDHDDHDDAPAIRAIDDDHEDDFVEEDDDGTPEKEPPDRATDDDDDDVFFPEDSPMTNLGDEDDEPTESLPPSQREDVRRDDIVPSSSEEETSRHSDDDDDAEDDDTAHPPSSLPRRPAGNETNDEPGKRKEMSHGAVAEEWDMD